jgi:predicted MPP superfamily phosphohydrolase
MILTLLQLSDWHIKESSDIDDVKIERMCNFVISNTGNSNDILIICTGDLAYSGKRQEFEKFEEILTSIKQRLNTKIVNIILVAGNHDCEYQPSDSIRPLIIKDVLERQRYDDEMVNILTKPLCNYYVSESKFKKGLIVNNKIGSKYQFQYDKVNVSVVSINTSWMSTLTTTPGATLFPLAEDFISERNNGISLLLMHHTPNWFHSDQQREIRKFLLNYTFVLTGHEHEGDSYSLQKDMYRSDMIEGDEFSPFKKNNKSGFNLVSIDLSNDKFKYLNAKLNDENYYVVKKTLRGPTFNPL